jgi:SAM-dependent methyltransferase
MDTPTTSYDTITYPGHTHPQTHPDRLEVLARLCGLDAPPAGRCRVLELGCGNGSNLVSMAWALPESELVGIDLAARPVALGQEMIRDLALTNVRLVHGNITEIDDAWGKFDYILAHGFYSWVPPEVQERMLEICRRALTPHGVAFVSYSALPGCHLKNMLREMMLFHIRDLTAPQERIDQAFALVRFLADGQDSEDEFRLWMKAEFKRMVEHEPGHLYHDELAEFNEALYFTQFMQRADRHGLQYLGEADYFEMSDHIFKDSVRATLQQLSRNRILREQYLDFLKCRRFRQTLLCQREIQLRTVDDATTVARFFIASAAECTSGVPDLRAGVKCAFTIPKRGKFETDYPLGKAALAVLGKSWPRPLAFADLLDQSLASLRDEPSAPPPGDDATRLCEFLLQLYGAEIVDFRTVMPSMAARAGDRPVASPIVRWQLGRGDFVTSLYHIGVKIEDEVGRALLSWLDGSNDREALLEKLWQMLKSRNALVVPDGDDAAARRQLAIKLEDNLAKLARFGLLLE